MFLKALFTLVGVYVILFIYSWKITLIAMALLVPMFIIMPLWSRLTQFTQKQYQEVKAETSSISNETFGNVKTVKAFSGEEIGCNDFNNSNEGVYNIGKNMAYYYAFLMASFILMNQGSFLGVAYFASEEVKNGELTPGEVASYMLYNWQIIFGIMGLNQNLQAVAKV